jgi:hypothetical protein
MLKKLIYIIFLKKIFNPQQKHEHNYLNYIYLEVVG